jgi:hypothetical protein
MAEKESTVDRGNDGATGRSGGIADVIFKPFEVIGNWIGKALDAILRDGTLEAAGRQGLDEIGAALKAFPDSIQVHETGTIWNPTPGEVMNSRDLGGHRRPSYSSLTPPRLTENSRQQPEQDHGHDNDGHSM